MAEQETDKIQSADGTDLTVAQLRDWLRNWVADATGQPASAISDDRPMEEFGLSSRDAVALSGEIEELVGVTLTATVVDGNVVLTDAAGGTATVTATDVAASNGVIHVIDTVLMPQ